MGTLEGRQAATEGTPGSFGKAANLVFITGPLHVAGVGTFSNCTLTAYAFSM